MAMRNLHDQTDSLLALIAETQNLMVEMESMAVAELEAVRDRYQPRIDALRQDRDGHEKKLLALMKRNKAVLFDGRDEVKLPHGCLFHAKKEKVVIPRDALERIEENGWTEAIKVVKTVIRPVVEAWPEVRLAAIGAAKKLMETFDYEISNEQPRGRAEK